jgi:replicative DNA helicase
VSTAIREVPAEPNPEIPEPPRFTGYTLQDARRDASAAGEGLSTGFAQLDAWGLRWNPGKLYAVVGRPGEGKTTLLLEILMRHIEAREAGKVSSDRAPAVLVTYEENRHDLFLRLLLREIARAGNRTPPPRHVAKTWLQTGKIAAADSMASMWDTLLRDAAERLDAHANAGRLTLVDGDRDGGDVRTLLGGLGAAAQTFGAPPSLVVVDYFQKIKPPQDEYLRTSRQAQLQEVADELRQYAKGQTGAREDDSLTAYAVPVVVGAQVNRETVRVGSKDKEDERQPELHHIREADDLANDAAGVLTLFRPEPGTLQVKGVKNRDGERDRIAKFAFDGACSHVGDAQIQAKRWD